MSMEGCPGSRMIDMRKEKGQTDQTGKPTASVASQLRQWPVQMHLISPAAPYYGGADVLLSADCVAYTVGGFHSDYLQGKSLGIACPKLDEGQDVYVEKVKSWIDDAKINTLTVMIMQVPCCSGLLQMAVQAAKEAERQVPIKAMVVDLQGEIIQEDWVEI